MFSKDLEVSIANLFDKAQEINIQYLTVEHLFLMILNDYDVKDFIEAQNVSVDSLKDEINEHLKKSSIMRTDNQKAVQPTLGFQRVLQRAVFHIQSSGKGVVKPINILVAIFSEKESRSVYILNKNNINRLDVVTYISHGPSDKKTNDNENLDEENIEKDQIKTEENAYLINLNNLVNEDKIDNLIGRTKEVDRLGGKIVATEWYSGEPKNLKRQFNFLRQVGFKLEQKENDFDDALGMEIDSLDALFDVSVDDFFDIPEINLRI